MITRRQKLLPLRKLLLPASLLALLILASCVPSGNAIPRGWPGGAIADGTLFIGSMDGKVVEVDTANGTKSLWNPPLRAIAAPSGGFGCAPTSTTVAIYGSPSVSGELVYLGGYNGKFYAFARGKDEPRWVYPREGTFGAPIVGGSIVAQGKVFFGVANGTVYALDAITGDRDWEISIGGKIWSTPAILNDALFIGSFDKKLYALDAATGEKKWTFETQGTIVAPPLASGNTVYVGSFDRYLYALDAATGQLKWKFPGAGWFWARPLVNNNVIYASSLDGKVYALDVQSGNKLAEFDVGNPKNPPSASPVLVGNSIIVATENGIVYALDTVSKEKKPLVSLGEKVLAPLVTDGKVVYIHTITGKLHAVNAQSGEKLWSLSLTSALPPSPQSPGGTNWGLIIVMTVIGLISVMLFSALRRRRA